MHRWKFLFVLQVLFGFLSSDSYCTQVEECLSVFSVEACTQDCNLYSIADVINRAYRRVTYLKDDVDRISVKELEDLIAHPQKKLYLCLTPENEVCGTLVLYLRDNEAEIGVFSIDPEYQGKNIGSLLLSYAEQQAFALDHIQSIRLNVIPLFQERLVKYYQRHGYLPVELAEFSDADKARFIRPEYEEMIYFCTLCKSKPIFELGAMEDYFLASVAGKESSGL